MPLEAVPDEAPWYITQDGSRIKLAWSQFARNGAASDISINKGPASLARGKQVDMSSIDPADASLVGQGIYTDRVVMAYGVSRSAEAFAVLLDAEWTADDFGEMYSRATAICEAFNFPPFGQSPAFLWQWIGEDLFWVQRPPVAGMVEGTTRPKESSWFYVSENDQFETNWPPFCDLEWAISVSESLAAVQMNLREVADEKIQDLVLLTARSLFQLGSFVTRRHLQNLHGERVDFGIASKAARGRGGESTAARAQRAKAEHRAAALWLVNTWADHDHSSREWKIPALCNALYAFMSKDPQGKVAEAPEPERMLLGGEHPLSYDQLKAAIKALCEEETFPLRVRLHGNSLRRSPVGAPPSS